MPIRSKLQTAAFAVVLALSLGTAIPGASAYQCEEQVNEALQQHNVTPQDVESVQVVRRSGGAKSASIYSLDAWVRLKSCDNGALVVNMTKYCMVQHSYTTGDCSVATMPNF